MKDFYHIDELHEAALVSKGCKHCKMQTLNPVLLEILKESKERAEVKSQRCQLLGVQAFKTASTATPKALG